MKLSHEKLAHLKALARDDGTIAALAIDQRKSLRKMIAASRDVPPEAVSDESLIEFKIAVARILSPFASAILLDPEYGLEAARCRAPGTGLLLTYEADGFENPRKNRMLALMPQVSVERLKQWGANGIKILLSYTPFDDERANDEKLALIEQIGAECEGAGVPFFLEFVGYDPSGGDEGGSQFARLKPEIVLRSMEEFSKDVYRADVMKVQVPVNAAFVEGSSFYKGQRAYGYREAVALFRRAAEVAGRPFIYLSAGVSHREFIEYLRMATEARADFSGVLCGRATWADGVPVYANHGVHALEDWLASEGIRNIQAINDALRSAAPWFAKRGLPLSAVA